MSCMFCTKCGGCELGRVGKVSAGTCPLCGHEVADSDTNCPNCGAPRLMPLSAPDAGERRNS